MAFVLFFLVNAALFIRPGEIVPALHGWEIYFYLIIACFLTAASDVMKKVLGQSPQTQPIAMCILGLAILAPLPFLVSGSVGDASKGAIILGKNVVYYFLFVSLVTTPERLRTLLVGVLTCAGAVTLLAVLRYHDVIQLNTIVALKDGTTGAYGEFVAIRRLQATGIFQDPNELCVLLAALLPIALYFLLSQSSLLLRGLSLAMIPLFLYAVSLTHSRGGFIAFAGGLGALAWMRFGWKKAALLGAAGLPVLLVLFGGRQTEISTRTGTAQSRIELWRDWMGTFRENPLLGNGMELPKEEDMKSRRPDEGIRHVAHNSFLQGFADMGLPGGCLWAGAFFTALWLLYRFNRNDCLILDSELKTMQPYLFAAVSAYCLGMMSLTLCYIAPSYMMLAIATTFDQMARRSSLAPPPPLRFDLAHLCRIAVVGLCMLFTIYVFIRLFA